MIFWLGLVTRVQAQATIGLGCDERRQECTTVHQAIVQSCAICDMIPDIFCAFATFANYEGNLNRICYCSYEKR